MTIRPCPTPNPNSIKFEVDGAPLIEDGLLAHHSLREASEHPLSVELFSLRGVESLLIVPDFVTVTKHPAADWDLLSEGVERVLEGYLEDGTSSARSTDG
ncbi:NifU N-terminal domain-containing protein [Rubrivirga sp.]|uniref:NifU N-terminal domain-containing protein n=1 Tax=Rubrivirga sp. TaxID=1885344 RepID=UPI003C73CD2A